MRRRWLWSICLSAVLSTTTLRGLGVWPTPSTPPRRPIPTAECAVESEPHMSQYQYRYLHSQPSHWRAVLLKH
jgi:hypothetical protein